MSERRFPRATVALFFLAAAAACSSTTEAPREPASAPVAESLAIINQVANQGRDFAKAQQMVTRPASSVTEAINTFDARAREYLANEACDPSSPFRTDAAQRIDDRWSGENWSSDALAMIAFDGNCVDGAGKIVDTPGARARMVSDKLYTYDADGKLLGTTIEPVLTYSRRADLDTALKDLMPILVRYRAKLTDAAYDHMLTFLQQVVAGPATSEFDEIHVSLATFLKLGPEIGFALDEISSIAGPVDYVALPETENHLHLIHSTRFLANELLFAKTRLPQFDNSKNGMRDYWLQRLASIMRHDFQEYNAKPYSRYSLDAIQNLAELTQDPTVANAARAVLDFSAAKYAVSSSLLRRESPYRRRVKANTDDFFYHGVTNDDERTIDEQACRFGLYAGTTDLYPTVAGANGSTVSLVPDSCLYVTRQAAGTYRVPPMILELAMNKAQEPYFQTFSGGFNDVRGSHGNLEIYDNEGPFLIAGGGVPNESGNDAVVHFPAGVTITIKNRGGDDDGTTVTTVVLPTKAATAPSPNITDVSEAVHIQSGLCIAPGFACGLDPIVPPNLTQVAKDNWTFVNQTTFYVAVYREVRAGQPFGFFEVVPAAKVGNDFNAFMNTVYNANKDVKPAIYSEDQGAPLVGVGYNSALGGRITADYFVNSRSYPITGLRGLPFPGPYADGWSFASGPMSGEHDGTVSIRVSDPSWPMPCVLDLHNPSAPVRSNCDGFPAGYTPPPPPPHSSLSWAHVSVPPGGNTSYLFPPSALVAGGVGSLNEYICRATTNGVSQYGHFDLTGKCWTPMPPGSVFGNAAAGATELDVLVYSAANADDAPMWLPIQNNALPSGMYVADQRTDGTIVNICRATSGTSLLPGVLTPTGCWIAINGTMTPFGTYEVLTLRNIPPVSSNPNPGCIATHVCGGRCGLISDGCSGWFDCGSCCPAGMHEDPSAGGCVFEPPCDDVACREDCQACNGSSGKCSANKCVCKSTHKCF